MKISYAKFPADVILCMLCSIILVPLAILNTGGTLRIILSLPFVLFFPGYILIFTLFPNKKTDRGIDIVERIGLSIGLSIVIVPLIGLGLNFTPAGINLEPLLSSIFVFIFVVGFIGILRWYRIKPNNRFILPIDIPIPKTENKIDKTLNILLIIAIIIAVTSLVYVVTIPKIGEQFTEFYILDTDRSADNYPQYLSLGESAEGIIGIINHEYKTMDYTIEIWLLNQSIEFNEKDQTNYSVIHNMWFLDKRTIKLDHTTIDLDKSWQPQWELDFTYTIKREGSLKLIFLLYTGPTGEYSYYEDYSDIAEEKLNKAYRELHIWIDNPYTTFYLKRLDGTAETYSRSLSAGDNISGFIGLANHEHISVNYTIEIWLVKQTIWYNETLQENITTIHNFWFVNKTWTFLEHTDNLTQWGQEYSYMIDKTGTFELMFLLYPMPTEGYHPGEDYAERADIKLLSAYKKLSISLDVI